MDEIHKFLDDYFETNDLHRTHESVRYVQFLLSKDNSEGDFNDLFSGQRTAVFRIKQWFNNQNIEPPQVGHVVVFANYFGEPLAVVKMSRVETVLYKDFTEEMARAAGVKNGDVNEWRETRHKSIEDDCNAINIAFNDEVELTAMWFDKLYPR